MRAANLTISVPYNGCDKNCPYCVSQMTGIIKPNIPLMWRNINKIQTLARAAQVTNVMFTGKGEPCLNFQILLRLLDKFDNFPCELQTNGIKLNMYPHLVEELQLHGIDLIAFSIDDLDQYTTYRKLFSKIQHLGMTTRVTLNVTNKIPESIRFDDIVDLCIENNVDQLLLRNIVIPNGVPETKHTKWIRENTNPSQYDTLIEQMKSDFYIAGTFLRSTEFGMRIWDYRGISVTSSDYCIQDSTNNSDIRSLIFLDDGHLYTSWNSKASRLL